tara:strand:- start:173 stop:796 length:624 start_codon:yes stop_codon:yes gene_type:complete
MVKLDRESIHNLKFRRLKKNIGILGGTFDPPHFGHLRISIRALHLLKLDEIWWVVSLSNPLKKKKKITEFHDRFCKVKNFNNHYKIIASDIERRLGTPYTSDVVLFLKKNFVNTNFIWLMGVDNLETFHLWKDWKFIINNIPIVIFDRPFYTLNIIKNSSLSFFRTKRICSNKVSVFKKMKHTRWIFLRGWSKHVSSSQINEYNNKK